MIFFTLGKQMSNYYAPCFYRIDFVVIPSYMELPCLCQANKFDIYIKWLIKWRNPLFPIHFRSYFITSNNESIAMSLNYLIWLYFYQSKPIHMKAFAPSMLALFFKIPPSKGQNYCYTYSLLQIKILWRLV